MRKTLFLSLLTAALVLILTPMTAYAAESAEASEGSRSSGAGVVNINTADVEQLALLPRIGPKAAERIVAYRKENGPFKKTTDLMQVKGVGDKMFEILSPYLAVDGKTTLATKQKGPGRSKAKRASKEASPQAQ
jgi:competence protein ComEA